MTPKPRLPLRTLVLSGFRAYLQPVAFDLAGKPCLAVFAPNGSGKSSLVDSFEFFLSDDGTLERLGLRRVNNQAGTEALVHRSASDAGVESFVELTAHINGAESTGKRLASGSKRTRPAVSKQIAEALIADPIVRGHKLRSFVETETPEQRYESVSRWLRLTPLVAAQRHLRALRQRVKAAAESDAELQAVDRRLKKVTGGVVSEWDQAAILTYITERLSGADDSLKPETLSKTDQWYGEVARRALIESERLGLEGLRQIRESLSNLVTLDPDTEVVSKECHAGAFSSTAAAYDEALRIEERERASAADTLLTELLTEAEKAFRDPEAAPVTCPVCTTAISESPLGSTKNVKEYLLRKLETIKRYVSAKKTLAAASTLAASKHQALVRSLRDLAPRLKSLDEGKAAELERIAEELSGWTIGAPVSIDAVVTQCAALVSFVDARIDAIVDSQGEHSFSALKALADQLVDLSEERAMAESVRAELETLSQELTRQATAVSTSIRSQVQRLLDSLEADINHLYREVQGATAARVRIELPNEEDLNQQRLQLLVDFAPNRLGVAPGGYLSDSQVHSLALALSIAAVRRFNTAAPFIVLDDVVTSYDADHRRALAALVAKELNELQVVLVTHDERFFIYLKDQLAAARWQFKRITGVDPSFGPRFADHMVTDEMIVAKWSTGASAANEVRQAEEEWLLRTCRDFGAVVRIRDTERAHSYERSELAIALAVALKTAGIVVPEIPGVQNPFLTSLQKGEIENFGSHFQDSPHGTGSIGDEKTRWAEFVEFRNLFVCPKCGKRRFKRPYQLTKPICNASGCEAQFEIVAQAEPQVGA